MKTNTKKSIQTLFDCPDQIVKVIRKSSGLARFPAHDYACTLFILKPAIGTRVRQLPDGSIEFLPNFDELRAMLGGIDPQLLRFLPDTFRNKPRQRQESYKRWNKARVGWKGGQK